VVVVFDRDARLPPGNANGNNKLLLIKAPAWGSVTILRTPNQASTFGNGILGQARIFVFAYFQN
jgi:hypothetical protein